MVEVVLPMQDRDAVQSCDCGGSMERLMSIPATVIMKVTGKDKILNTLNGERKGERSKRSQMALAKGLDQTRPVIGRGF